VWLDVHLRLAVLVSDFPTHFRRVVGEGDNVAVCLLDSGIRRAHPLIAPALAAADCHTIMRVHRKLRAASVVADLIVFEGQSHAQYLFVPDAPEAKECFTEVTAFFDRHLEK